MQFDSANSVSLVSELRLRSTRVNELSGRVAKEVVQSLENWAKTQSDEMEKLLEQIKFTIELVENPE